MSFDYTDVLMCCSIQTFKRMPIDDILSWSCHDILTLLICNFWYLVIANHDIIIQGRRMLFLCLGILHCRL